MAAANYVYSVAKPDGLTIGTFGPSMYFDQLSRRKEVRFDWAKFTWIGTPEQTEFILIMRTDNPYQSIEDVRKAAHAAQVRRHGNEHFRLLHAEIFG